MKKTTTLTFPISLIISLIITSLTITSCEKPECKKCESIEDENTKSTLSLTIEGNSTKSTTVLTQNEDNAINTVDIFIFRNTGVNSPDHQQLDTYKRVTGADIADIKIETTTGPKTVCVIINEHENTNKFNSITNITKLRGLVSNLKNEQLGSYTMYGEAETTLDITSTLTISVTRLISRVALTSIKTKFAGTPYEGYVINNIKLYLTNAHAQKVIYNGASPSTPLIYNKNQLIAQDAECTTEPNILAENIVGNVGDTPLVKNYFFYCYSNETEEISTCTKLVLQADLNGITYYYPIPINQTNYGHDSTFDHYGIKRNTCYSYSVVITKPGSLDPNTPLLPGTLDLSITVKDWVVIPHFEKTF